MGTKLGRAHRIAVVSGKGGVGKTVITANLGAKLAMGGRRVLILDADLGLANLDILLGVNPQYTLIDVMHGRRSLDEVLIRTEKGFDLLPAGSGLPEGTAYTQILSDCMDSVLKSVEQSYDIILFDAGAGVGDVVLFFAGLSDEVLLIVTPEPTSLMDSYATLKIIHRLHKRNEFLLIVNQANPDCSGQIGAQIVGHLQTVISRFIDSNQEKPVRVELIGSIPVDPAIPKAIRKRQLLAENYPDAPSSCLMSSLADYLHTRIAC